jgi:hypothetical protein
MLDDLALEGIPGKRSKRTDEELLALWAAYDDEFANTSSYVEALKKTFSQYKEFIRPIEQTVHSDYLGNWNNRVRGVWMTGFGHPRLALIVDRAMRSNTRQDWSMFSGDRNPKHWFKAWVPPEMEAFVLTKTMREYGSIATIDPVVLDNHVPEPPGYLHELKDEIPRKGGRFDSAPLGA